MAIVADKNLTLLDRAKFFGENGEVLAIAEVLSQTNDILKDMPVVESNMDSGHLYAVRTGIPEGTWRRAYLGVKQDKSTVKQVAEPYGTLGIYSVVDKLIAEKGGKLNETRFQQAKGILQGLSNQMAEGLFYGNVGKNPERFTGLAARYNELDEDEAESARNVVDAGGSTNLSSAYLVVFDSDKVYGFYPKGTKAGIERIDFGLKNCPDGKGNEYPAYKEYFEWKLGLAVQDWRYAGRVCNIDTTNMTEALLDKMMDLEERIQSLSVGTPVWYVNRTVKAGLRKLLSKKTNVNYTPAQPNARPVLTFDEIPVHVCDAISNAETKVA